MEVLRFEATAVEFDEKLEVTRLTPQLHESAGGLPSLKLSLHSCSLPGSTNAMGIETSIALVLMVVRELLIQITRGACVYWDFSKGKVEQEPLHISNEWLDVFYALQDLWQFKHQFTPNASDQDLQQDSVMAGCSKKTEGKGSGKGRSKITGKRGAHKEKKREEEDDDTRTVYERSKGMMEFVLLLSVDVRTLCFKNTLGFSVDGLSMKDWRGRRAVSFNIISSGASLYKGKGQTLSQVGFAMTINKARAKHFRSVEVGTSEFVFEKRGASQTLGVVNGSCSSHEQTMSKNNGTTIKRKLFIWTPVMDEVFIDLMLKEQNKGNRPEGTFTSQAYTNCPQHMRLSVLTMMMDTTQ
ncbi:Myb/SANT-like domain-containing protein [Tanacetum coccineum]